MPPAWPSTASRPAPRRQLPDEGLVVGCGDPLLHPGEHPGQVTRQQRGGVEPEPGKDGGTIDPVGEKKKGTAYFFTRFW